MINDLPTLLPLYGPDATTVPLALPRRGRRWGRVAFAAGLAFAAVVGMVAGWVLGASGLVA